MGRGPELSSWSWKLRSKQTNQAQVQKDAEQAKSEPAKPVEETARRRPEVKETEKLPA